MRKHLVLVGGGHAHMETLSNLHRFSQTGHRVTVVGPSPHHYYSGMGPGMLGRSYTPDQVRFETRRGVEKQGGVFVRDTVVQVEPQQKKAVLASGRSLNYDVISFNTGSYVPHSLAVDGTAGVYTVKPIENLIEAQRRILELTASGPATIAVVGGGAAAVELAGNIWRLAHISGGHMPGIRVYAGQGLMTSFPETVRQRIRRSLARRAIEIVEPEMVVKVDTGAVWLASGRRQESDLTLLAVGVKPSPIFAASGLPVGPEGGLRVNRYLQCTVYPEIFGGGDCVYFEDQPLDKVGVYAVRQNPILLHNLQAALSGGTLQAFDPRGDYLLIFNLGDGTGVMHKSGFTLDGRIAFRIKDFIDRRFMRRYQKSFI